MARQPPRPKTLQSSVTTGARHFLAGGEQAPMGRRIRDVFDLIADDRGGIDRISEAQAQLIRRFATLAGQCEQMESLAAKGSEDFDLERYMAASNVMSRLSVRIGLDRVAREVTGVPSIAQLKAGAA